MVIVDHVTGSLTPDPAREERDRICLVVGTVARGGDLTEML